MDKKRVLIMGAAGRDFHNFNCYFRNNDNYEVVAFTATQIPDIEGRCYPAALAGKNYPDGIPIKAEKELVDIIRKKKVDEVIFAYSDVSHEYVMHKACTVISAGANFGFLGADSTMIKSIKPVISVCAVRTGCGKSQTTRKVSKVLQALGKKVTIIRHPMPYGNLEEQKCQRFATMEDLDKHNCTIEEREEYEPHIKNGNIVYAGVDYETIIRAAEKEADIVLWDGGNNDLSFYHSDLEIVVTDPLRVGHEILYYPGEANLLRADVVIINKVDSAGLAPLIALRDQIRGANPNATIVEAASPIYVKEYKQIQNKRCLVVEDGPTMTHGGMTYGAGIMAAKRFGAAEIIDPRPFAVGTILATYQKYPKIGTLLPAMGYGKKQVKDLEETINKSNCDIVVSATPINLSKIVKVNKPIVDVSYELEEIGLPNLKVLLEEFVAKHCK